MIEVLDGLRDASGRAKKIQEVIRTLKKAAEHQACNDSVLDALRCDFMQNLIQLAKIAGKATKVVGVAGHRLFLCVDVHHGDIRVIGAALPVACNERMGQLHPIYGKRRQAKRDAIGIAMEAALDALDGFDVDDADLRLATLFYAKKRLATVDVCDERKAAAVELVSYINALGVRGGTWLNHC